MQEINIKCLRPKKVLVVTYPQYKRREMLFSEKEQKKAQFSGLPFDEIQIPCGKCLHCLVKKARLKTIQMIHEEKCSQNVVFMTLTYSKEGLRRSYYNEIKRLGTKIIKENIKIRNQFYNEPEILRKALGRVEYLKEKIRKVVKNGQYGIHYNDFSAFMKRLRRHEVFHYGHSRVRFFVGFEHGTKRFRPHAHAIIYNLSDELMRSFRFHSFSSKGSELYTSESINKLWSFGYVLTCKNLSDKSMFYSAGYAFGKNKSRYGDECHRSSNGLGLPFAGQFLDDIMRHGFITYNGVKYGIPLTYKNYYFNKLAINNILSDWHTYSPSDDKEILQEYLKDVKWDYFINKSNNFDKKIYDKERLKDEAQRIYERLVEVRS